MQPICPSLLTRDEKLYLGGGAMRPPTLPTVLHHKTLIGRSTSPAGNDCLDPYFGLSCVIGWVQPYHLEGFFGHDPRGTIFWEIRDRVWYGIFWEILCGSLFRYYLPDGYKLNHVIAITKTGYDTGYLEIRYLTGSFDITFDTVDLCLSCTCDSR